MSDNENLYASLTQPWSMQVEMPFKKEDGTSITLPMCVLSGRQLYEAKQKAEADTRASYGKDIPKKDESSEWDSKYSDHLAYYMIFYSVRRPDDISKRVFPSKESVMDCMTSDQAGILSNCYMSVQINQPWLLHLEQDDSARMEELLQRVIACGKEPAFFLNSLTSLGQNNLICFLAAKLARLQKDSGSRTVPQDDGAISS